jgi:hypothetical protein
MHYEQKNYPIEIKIYYGRKTLEDGITQLTKYMDGLGKATGWLVIFDLTPKKPWTKKIYWKTIEKEEKTIHVVGA